MKDFSPKGTGNSRFLKSSISASETWEQFRAKLIAGNAPVDFNGVNVDGVNEVGTPLNKANLLSDETATAIGLTPTLNPTVNEALLLLSNYDKIGTIKRTIRTDLGEDWLLCNGANIDRRDYPDMVELCPYGSILNSTPFSTYQNRVLKYLNNEYIVLTSDSSNTYVYTSSSLSGTWTLVNTIGKAYPCDIGYCNGYYLVVYGDRFVYHSTSINGTFNIWSTVTGSTSSNYNWNRVETFKNNFVVMSTGAAACFAYGTVPGVNFTPVSVSQYANSLAVGNNYLILSTGISNFKFLYTDNLATPPTEVLVTVGDLNYVNGYYFAYYEGVGTKVGTSPTTIDTLLSIAPIKRIFYLNNLYYFVIYDTDLKFKLYVSSTLNSRENWTFINELQSVTSIGNDYRTIECDVINNLISYCGSSAGKYHIQDLYSLKLPTVTNGSFEYNFVKAL